MNSYEMIFDRGVRLSQQGKIRESLEIFKDLYSSHPQHISVMLNYGTLLYKNHDLNEAKLIFTEIINIDYLNFMAYYNRALIYFSEDQFENSYKDISLATSLLCLERGKKLQNISFLDKAIEINNGNALAYIERAKLYEKLDNISRAEQNFNSAVRIRENHFYPYVERAEFYWRNKNIKEAEKDIIKYRSLKTKTDNPSRLALLPEIHAFLGQNKEESLEKIKGLVLEFEGVYQENKIQYHETQIKQSKKSISMLEESSKNISKEIEELQKQIEGKRGEILQPDSGSFNNENFLEDQIEKVAKDIQIHKKNVQEAEHSETSSFSSKFTEPKLIDSKLFKSYSKFKLEITSAQIFDHEEIKGYGDGRVRVEYEGLKKETEYSNQNMWNKKYNFQIIHKDPIIKIEFEMKGKGFWSSNKVIGKGEINIMEAGEVKCIISSEDIKTGIVYYKIKLIE